MPDIRLQADFSGGNSFLFVAIHVLFQRIDFVQVEKAVAAGEYISTSTTTRNKSERLGVQGPWVVLFQYRYNGRR